MSRFFRGATLWIPLALIAPVSAGPFPAAAEERVAAIGPQEAGSRQIRSELAAISGQIRITQETLARLRSEAAELALDREALSRRLVDSARAAESLAAELAALEVRLGRMAARSLELDRSLAERQRVLTGLLAAMQRLGRSPPPAVLVRPDDAIGALRSAMMLGRVVPAVQQETAALGREIDELATLSTAMESAKAAYADRLAARRVEEARLESLIAERRQAETRSQAESEALAARAERLSARAATLEQLIAALDKADAPERHETAPQPETRYDIASLRENMPRLRGNAAFSTLKGVLNRPVSGETILGFGQADAGGRSSSGMRFAGIFGDRVTAPADAEVLYAGPFRSYGQLLILNAGDGYHIVLAGMAEIDVDVGQFVLAGEPVARMGARRLAERDDGQYPPESGPELYVEFRKDGQPVDPAPWWAERPSGRTRNDT
ncbi:peptidoglycan DD-metalloendopeptidase family protein [Aureimonas altamirensis]|uniref:murein hydrolase activator EnvC family protein n=1 Tax=Aureimonas altamirensis TaxID=370622 RepID=UPI0020370FDA|nr:peptidoglycan DD-metalloendopeptidase family protein [Aureimonas altamirensis]